jgi:exonuclease SbcC
LKALNAQEQELTKLLPKKDEWIKLKKKKGELELEQKKFIRLKELEEQWRGVVEQVKKHEGILTEERKKIKDFERLEEKFKEYQSAKAKLEDEIEKNTKLRSEYNAKSEQLKIEIEKINDKLKEIHELGPESECPTCERPLKEHYQYLENKFNNENSEMAAKLEKSVKSEKEFEKKLGDAKKRIEALNKREKFLNQQAEERARMESTIKASESELEHHETKQKELASSLNEIKDVKFDDVEFKQINVKYQELEKVNERIITLNGQVKMIPKLRKELKGINEAQNTISSSITRLEGDLAQQGFNEELLEGLETKYDEAVEKLKVQELALKDEENKNRLNAEKIEQFTSKIKELQELEEKIKVYEEKLMYLVKLDIILNKFKNYLIGRIAPTLTLYASDLFRELTDGKYNRLEIDQDYNVMLYDDGTPFSLQRYSGGEEDLANLCLRLAISQVITAQAGTSNLNFIILDEIFGSQDLHRKRNLLQALNGLTNKFRQIFLITHIEDVKDYISYNIQVSENADGTSSTSLIN